MDVLESEKKERVSFISGEADSFDQIELLEIESYLNCIPKIISENLRKTYHLPEQKWQLQQTNGFRLYRKGLFPIF